MSRHVYLPQTQDEVRAMLEVVGARSVQDLFADVPASLLDTGMGELPAGLPESAVRARLEDLAARNHTDLVSFLGCGSYDHAIPAVVDHLCARSEFSTAYTPYQAEIAQGMLQAIFEFQTMIAEVCGLDASNASLYDGATAACEAAAMALGSVRKSSTVLCASTLPPAVKQVMRTRFSFLDVELEEVDERDGVMDLDDLKRRLRPGVAALVLASPNHLGYLEDMCAAAAMVHEAGALVVAYVNPLSLGVLCPPGQMGADMAVGDAQPLGLAPAYGGPTAGFMACREALLRRMPGRIVGQSVDRDGRRAFLLTLQAREQHIKRERATSNICSNQALAALAVAIHLATLGPEGLRETALLCMNGARYLHDRMVGELDARPASRRPFFNEFAVRLSRDPKDVVARMQERGFLAGCALGEQEAGRDGLLGVAVTERRTRVEMDRYVAAMKEVLA